MTDQLHISLKLTGTATVNGGIEVPFERNIGLSLDVTDVTGDQDNNLTEVILGAVKDELGCVLQDAVDHAERGFKRSK